MPVGQLTLLVYAALMLVGGLVGYARAGSRPSLISGSLGAALLVGAWYVGRSDLALGAWIGAGVTALLIVAFAVRLGKTRKFMPSGMLLVLSAVALGLLVSSALGLV